MKFNPFPAAIRPKVRSILRRYHDLKIISYAEDDIKDPIISNLVVIKKGNNQIRLAFDSRIINYYTAKGKCYHRSLSQTVRDIDLNSRYFSTLDLSSAYFCIPLHPDSRRYFCFRDADNKLCTFNVTVQGFVESDQHLSRVLELIFPLDLPPEKRPITYQDDFVVATNSSLEEGVEQLIEVLKKLKDAGLRINPKKVKLFKPSVVFLGLLIHRGAIHIPEERVKSFVDYPTPSNRLELRRFINSMGFFRNSIPHYAELSFDLLDLVTR